MHWPVAFANPNSSQIKALKSSGGHPVEDHKLSADLATTWREMERMVQKGKVRNIGVSNFNIRRTEELLKATTDSNPVINQVEVNFGVANEELLHYSEAHQILLQAYSPLGGSANIEKYLNEPIILDVAKRNNMTPAQVMLAWPLARGIIPITKSVTPERIEENFGALNKELEWDDVVHLTRESQSRPIDRSVDPSETWATHEDIFEDEKDHTMLNSLKTDRFEVPRPHESDGSHYLEPRNDPEAPEIGPGGTAKREMHTMASSQPAGISSKPRATVLQQLMRRNGGVHRAFSTSAQSSATAAEKAPPAAEELPVVGSSSFLRSNAKAATQTPGIEWTDGEKGIERQVRKMNMYTVRGSCGAAFSIGGASRSFSSSSSAALAAAETTPLAVSSSPLSTSPMAPSKSRRARASGLARVYPPRKTFLFAQYQRLLEQSKLVVLLQHNSLSVADFSRVRNEIASVPCEEGSSAARLTVVRSGLMRVLAQGSFPSSRRKSKALFSGPLALLTFDHLSPNYISRVLSVLDRTLGAGRAQPKPAPGQSYQQAKAVTNVNTRLTPVAAVVEHNADIKVLMDIAGLRDVSLLPGLDALRGQVVALLNATPSRLVATLDQARGGDVSRILEARHRALESEATAVSTQG